MPGKKYCDRLNGRVTNGTGDATLTGFSIKGDGTRVSLTMAIDQDGNGMGSVTKGVKLCAIVDNNVYAVATASAGLPTVTVTRANVGHLITGAFAVVADIASTAKATLTEVLDVGEDE